MIFGFSRNKHILKIGFFFTIAHLTIQAAISGPLFVVEKALEPQRLTVNITCSQIPELKCATFTCTYAIPKAALMEAIVSSPQPGTALSVTVDSSASTLSVAIQAATTISPVENARIVVFKIPVTATFDAADFAVTTAVILNKAGTSTTVAISNKTAGIGTYFRAVDAFPPRHGAGDFATFRIDGKKENGAARGRVCCMRIVRQDGLRTAPIVSVW